MAEVGKPKHEYTSCAIPEEMFDAIKQIVPQEEMEAAADLAVTLEVDVNVGGSWFETK